MFGELQLSELIREDESLKSLFVVIRLYTPKTLLEAFRTPNPKPLNIVCCLGLKGFTTEVFQILATSLKTLLEKYERSLTLHILLLMI